jgi:hypothetical protein
MFFYLYMITVFLEMLLVTGIIPTASSVYPVSICLQRTCIAKCNFLFLFSVAYTVVHSRSCWFNKCYILVLIVERFCWVSIR